MRDVLLRLVDSPELLEVGRKAVEDVLVEWRDARLSVLGRNNGLCIRERDGQPSTIIRLATEQALATALRAIADAVPRTEDPQ